MIAKNQIYFLAYQRRDAARSTPRPHENKFRVSLAVLVIVLFVLVYGRNTVLQQQIAYGLVQQSAFRDASLGGQLVEQRYKVVVERGREAAAVFQEGFSHNGKVPL